MEESQKAPRVWLGRMVGAEQISSCQKRATAARRHAEPEDPSKKVCAGDPVSSDMAKQSMGENIRPVL